MSRKPKSSSGGGLPGVRAALERAQADAREIARRTGTPLVVFKDGRIQMLRATSRKKAKTK
jgi:hypothetical protein